jgi:putative heme transporter
VTPWIRGRVRRRRSDVDERHQDTEFVEIKSAELSGIFAAPPWLRDFGVMAWLLVGVVVLLVGAVWLLSVMSTIVTPVVTAAIATAVLSPLVGYLERRRVPRAAGAALVFLLIAVLGALILVMILTGIGNQTGNLTDKLQDAAHKIQGWLEDVGVSADSAQHANDDASSSVSSGFHALVNGLETGINALASLAVFLAFTSLSLFFLLKDGPTIKAWAERHLGVPEPVARTIMDRTAGAL